MVSFRVSREDLTKTLVQVLEPLDYVQAFWEGGAAGFNRVDDWSDADLQIMAVDGLVEEVFEVVENALETLSPIDLKFRLPEPTWHGHSQCFYRLEDASPFLMVDLVVMQAGSEADRYMETRIHGTPVVHFDKVGVVINVPVDTDAHLKRIEERISFLKVQFDLFQILSQKEIHSGNGIEAAAFYTGYTLRPLLEALRIKHCPIRFFYSTRYAHYDLPEAVVSRLQRLYFPSGLDDLAQKRAEAESWFWEVIEGLDMEAIKKKTG